MNLSNFKTHTVIRSNLDKVADNLSDLATGKLGARVGAMFEAALVDKISEGDPSWAPLSASWAEEKGHGNQWYYTGRLEGAIKYKVDGTKVHIGIVDPEVYPTGETIASVAEKLEYGDSKIPARPLFQPVFHENEKEVIKAAKEWIKGQVAKGRLI